MQDAKRRALLFLVVALLLSAIAGYMFLQKVSEVDETLGNFTTVYVAQKSIKSRQLLKPDDFTAVKVPQQYVQQSAVTNLQGIKLENGNYPITMLVSVVSLSEGDLLTTNMLKPQTTLSSNGKRMVMLSRSDKVGFDDVFNYNDMVDIIVTKRQGQEFKTVVYKESVPIVALAKDEQGNITGLGLEMTLAEAADFIDQQVNAANIRVLKAPNVQGEGKAGQKAVNNGQNAKALNQQTKTKTPETGGIPQEDLPEGASQKQP
ncbi:hypothetical protein [Laceyella tengchongensis]